MTATDDDQREPSISSEDVKASEADRHVESRDKPKSRRKRPWLLSVLTGLLAFMLGLGLGLGIHAFARPHQLHEQLPGGQKASFTEIVDICQSGFSGVAQGRTSCQFADATRAVWFSQGGQPFIQVWSPVTNEFYTLACDPNTITLNTGVTKRAVRCEGGNGAVVYFWR